MKLKSACRGGWIALLAAAADRASKAWISGHSGEIPGLARFRTVLNTGVAFSFLENAGWALAAFIAALVVGVTAWLTLDANMPRLQRTGLWLIVGGGLGNLYDRLFYGAVIDFIEVAFVRFAVFNVADICICVGAALAMIAMLMEEKCKNAGKAV